VTTTMTIAGDADAFDAAAQASFIGSFEAKFPSAQSVRLTISPGSIQVTVLATFADHATASAAAVLISSANAGEASSWFTGVTLTSSPTSPVVESVIIPNPSPPPPSIPSPLPPLNPPTSPPIPSNPQAGVTCGDSCVRYAVVAVVAVLVLAVVMIATVLAVRARWLRRHVRRLRRDQNVDGGDVEVDECGLPTTSSTTAPPVPLPPPWNDASRPSGPATAAAGAAPPVTRTPSYRLSPTVDLIVAVLSVPLFLDGQMSEDEALRILHVTDKKAKWLLSQVHPDRNPERRADATLATARVNQAMDVRSRGLEEPFVV